jgi:3-dehydroquinate dehydratase-1
MTTTPPTVRLKSVVLGEGRPKVCVPLVASTAESLRAAAAGLPAGDFDLVELRIDFFDGVDDAESVTAALASVRDALPDGIPILFTFRTAGEGGQREISPDAYEALLARTPSMWRCSPSARTSSGLSPTRMPPGYPW